MNFLWHEIFIPMVKIVDYYVMFILMIYSSHYLFQLSSACLVVLRARISARHSDPWWLMTSRTTFPISICVPAYNEEKTIVDNVNSLLSLNYPDYEVVITNDGSKDGTIQVMKDCFGMEKVDRAFDLPVACKPVRGVYASKRFPNLTLVDKENGGRSDALNCSLNFARNPS